MIKKLPIVIIILMMSYYLKAQSLSVSAGYGLQFTKMGNVNKAIQFYNASDSVHFNDLNQMNNLYISFQHNLNRLKKISISLNVDYLFKEIQSESILFIDEVNPEKNSVLSTKYYDFEFKPTALIISFSPSYEVFGRNNFQLNVDLGVNYYISKLEQGGIHVGDLSSTHPYSQGYIQYKSTTMSWQTGLVAKWKLGDRVLLNAKFGYRAGVVKNLGEDNLDIENGTYVLGKDQTFYPIAYSPELDFSGINFSVALAVSINKISTLNP